MGRTERRQRTALDEAYRYYNRVESGEEQLDLFRVTKSVRTLAFALAFCDTGEFKLTRQLWRRLHQALFDKLLTNYSGRIAVLDDATRAPLEARTEFPERGYLEFYPENCRRADDVSEIEIVRLYPKTQLVLKHCWENRGALVHPEDFEIADCDGGVCFMKPMVTGHEILAVESRKGKDEAYSRWWELYWQAYCTPDRRQQEMITRQMSELEAVWGNLYY